MAASVLEVIAQLEDGRDGDGMREARRAVADLIAALSKYERAFDTMFSQCLSNPITDCWGRPIDLTELNQAHQWACIALANAGVKP